MVNCVVIGVLAILAVVNGATVLSGDEYAEGVLVPTPASARSLLSRLDAEPIPAVPLDCATGDLTGNFCDTDCKSLVVILKYIIFF